MSAAFARIAGASKIEPASTAIIFRIVRFSRSPGMLRIFAAENDSLMTDARRTVTSGGENCRFIARTAACCGTA
jgi:hypothetical protein